VGIVSRGWGREKRVGKFALLPHAKVGGGGLKAVREKGVHGKNADRKRAKPGREKPGAGAMRVTARLKRGGGARGGRRKDLP